MVVEMKMKGSSENKGSTTKENGSSVSMKSGTGSNGGSEEHRVESNGGSNGRALMKSAEHCCCRIGGCRETVLISIDEVRISVLKETQSAVY